MNNNIHIGTAFPGPTVPLWQVLVGVSDFNRDGNPDYLLFGPNIDPDLRPSFGTLIWYMRNNVQVGSVYGPTLPRGWSLAGATDFNRNGSADYLLYNWSTNQTAIWYMRNNVFVGSASGPSIPSGWDLFAP